MDGHFTSPDQEMVLDAPKFINTMFALGSHLRDDLTNLWNYCEHQPHNYLPTTGSLKYGRGLGYLISIYNGLVPFHNITVTS